MCSSDLAMVEPLACVLHCLDMGERAHTRYRFQGTGGRVRTAVVLGAGPAGLLFVQALRAVCAFDGVVLVSDPSPLKRASAQRLGAIAVAPAELPAAVRQHGEGRGAEFLVEASGAGHVFAGIPALLRKQGTVLLYGVGHGSAPMTLLNPLQWRELSLVTSVGASGGFDADGRPSVYRRAQELLARGQVVVEPLLTHRYEGLAAVPNAFGAVAQEPGYVKGVAVFG